MTTPIKPDTRKSGDRWTAARMRRKGRVKDFDAALMLGVGKDIEAAKNAALDAFAVELDAKAEMHTYIKRDIK